MVSKLHGGKEKAFVPRNCSIAVFSLNFSHVFCDLLIFLNKDKLSAPQNGSYMPLWNVALNPQSICAAGDSDLPSPASKLRLVRLVSDAL